MKSSNSILNVYNIAKPHGTKKIILIISAIFGSFYNFIIANIINMLFQGSNEMNKHKLILFAICIVTVILGARKNIENLQIILKELSKTTGILIVSHQEASLEISDRIYFMNGGGLYEE